MLCALALAMTATAAAQTGVAAVEFDDQTSDGTFVIVQQVTLSNGGFVVIHDERLDADDAVGSVVGFSEYLSIGTHDDVRVNISINQETVPDQNTTGNVTLVAMPHFDSNDNEEFDFVTSDGQDDGAYTQGGAAVTDSAQVTFEEDGTVGAERGDDDEDTPGFEIVALVAALGAALVLVRRRT